MIHEVKCKHCACLLIKIDKPQVLQEDIDMYKQNSFCNICLNHLEKYGEIFHKIISFFSKLFRFLRLKK